MDASLLAELRKQESAVSVSEAPRHYRMWIYGEPGSGKTELAGRLMGLDDKPCGLISSDSAWITLLKQPEVAKKVIRYKYEGLSQVRAIAQAANEGIEPYASFGTVVWDTVSTAIDWTIAKLVQAKKFNDQRDPDAPSWTHYNLVAQAMKPTIDALNGAPFNVIYLSHVREPSQDDKEKRKMFAIRPNTPEACFKQIAQEVQLLGWLHKEKEGGQRSLQVEGTNRVSGKSQIFTIDEGTYPVEDIPPLIAKWKEMSESASISDAIQVEE